MARPSRNDVDYFPFMCKEGKAMFCIEEKYGNDGFAAWIKILRSLATTNFHYINLSDPSEKMFLSAKCKISENVLDGIITDLCNLGEFDKELWENYSVIYSEKFIESVRDAYSKRNNNPLDKNELSEHLGLLGVNKPIKSTPKHSKEPLKGVENPQSKKEYTIVKESIEENNKILPLKVNPNKVNEVLKMFDETNFEQKERIYKTNKENIRIKLLEFLETESLNDTFVNKPLGNVIKHFFNWLQYSKPREVVSKDNSVPSWITDKR